MTNYGTDSPYLLAVPEVKIVKPGHRRESAEKNELLNCTDVKMRDFESIDSEDFLEEENECCVGKCTYIKRRTKLEKILFLLFIISFCVLVGLLVKSSPSSQEDNGTCTTKACVEVAASLLSSMDTTVNPCVDFYKYSCGGWERSTPIPPGFSYWDKTQELAYRNMYGLHRILEEPHGPKDSFAKAKQFHDSCMNEDSLNKTVIQSYFKSLIDHISGSEENFTFPTVLEKVHQLNTWPLFTVSVGPDEWKGDRNVIKISQSDLQYPLHVLLNTTSETHSKYLQLDAKQVKDGYVTDMVNTIKMFWNKPDEEATKMAESLLQLDIDLTKTRRTEDITFDRANVYKNTTIAELQQKCSMIDWELYLTTLAYDTATIKNTDKLVILHEDKLVEVCNIVNSYKEHRENATVLYYYLLVHTVRSFMPYFEVSTFKDYSEKTELNFDGETWRRCTHYTNQAFGFATAAAYVNKTAQHDKIDNIKQLVNNVKEVFKSFVLRKIWFKEEIRDQAYQKIDKMLEKINYPSYMLQQSFLDKYYKTFETGSNWFENLKSWKKFIVSSMFSQLGKVTDKESWLTPPFTVESDYDPVRNELHFPTAILHLPFYSFEGPATFNYGALGSVIGHEITHAFDILGRQYNEKGKLENWWDPLTISSFNKTAKCMVEQYDSFKPGGYQINGYKTLDENIADNGGLRAAYFAYQMWTRDRKDSTRLPGVELDDRQLFFVSFAQMFCTKWRPDGLQKHIIDDVHSPGSERVRGVISNMITFGDAFNCPFIAPYNPEKKCQVW